MKKNILVSESFKVPVHDVDVWVIVARDAEKALKRSKRFPSKDSNFTAISIGNEQSEFGMFFHAGMTSFSVIGHEIYHIVQFIVEQLRIKDEETEASIQGFILLETVKLLKRNKIKIYHE